MSLRQKLLKNIRNFKKSADLVYDTQDYTSACILYFKVLFGLIDHRIFAEYGVIPKDHTERFNILKSRLPDLYEILNKLFPYYRQTYSKTIEKNICDEVKKNAENLVEKQKVKI